MDRLKDQIAQIEATTESACPLCGQSLGDEQRADLLHKLEVEGHQRGDLHRANSERVKAINNEDARLVKDIQAADYELRNLPPLREHVTRQSERTNRAAEALSLLEEVEARRSVLEARLAAQDYAADAQQALAEIDAQLAELGYDEQAHQQARAATLENELFEELRAELERAREGIPEVESAIAGLDRQEADWGAQQQEEQARLDTLGAEIEALDQQLAEFGHWERLLADLRDQERQADLRVGAATQKLNALEQLRVRREALIQEREQLGADRSIYEELRVAFGKDGVPAMIIEAAIPEIEQEANDILARMTDGRMHLRFDTQREKVTGGTKETLDIKIADEIGTRDYATFSGGEAFRVNFAVRLALSRLLARRAGAQLRTLIIDEGFGTQDTQGRERLVQAINAIQDEFDLILVITHIDELKDAFPARIEITKTPDGSVMEVY
jgi:exonuclease SbcC